MGTSTIQKINHNHPNLEANMSNENNHKHPLANAWDNGKGTLNGWLSLANSFSAEIMAQQGFDSITIDMQHGVSDYESMFTMLQAMQSKPAPILARVPWLDPVHIMKTLDAGISGIICPMVNSKEDAQNLVNWSHYPPLGKRSFGPIRAKYCYQENYVEIANDKILIIAMIETKEAIDNLEDILSVEGIDAIYIGPADLSLALGATPKFDQEDPKVYKQIEYIVSTAKSHGKYAGIHNGSVSYAKRMIEMGFDFVTIGSDALTLTNGAASMVKEFNNNDTKKVSDSY